MRKQAVLAGTRPALERARAALERAGFAIGEAPHALFQATGEDVRVTAYASGKVLVQGKGTEDLLARLAPLLSVPAAPAARAQDDHAIVGSDESGKGDYFGSLVVAACCVAPADAEWLLALGVRDSKTASRLEIETACREIERRLPHAVREFEPAEYNRVHASCGNVNAILGDAHAAVIRELLERTGARHVIVDRFGGEHYVREALGAAAQGVRLDQVPRGEANLAVAAASFLARARFVASLERLSERIGFRLLPGASAPAERCARDLVRARGNAVLAEVAKLHFRTTERVIDRGRGGPLPSWNR